MENTCSLNTQLADAICTLFNTYNDKQDLQVAYDLQNQNSTLSKIIIQLQQKCNAYPFYEHNKNLTFLANNVLQTSNFECFYDTLVVQMDIRYSDNISEEQKKCTFKTVLQEIQQLLKDCGTIYQIIPVFDNEQKNIKIRIQSKNSQILQLPSILHYFEDIKMKCQLQNCLIQTRLVQCDITLDCPKQTCFQKVFDNFNQYFRENDAFNVQQHSNSSIQVQSQFFIIKIYDKLYQNMQSKNVRNLYDSNMFELLGLHSKVPEIDKYLEDGWSRIEIKLQFKDLIVENGEDYEQYHYKVFINILDFLNFIENYLKQNKIQLFCPGLKRMIRHLQHTLEEQQQLQQNIPCIFKDKFEVVNAIFKTLFSSMIFIENAYNTLFSNLNATSEIFIVDRQQYHKFEVYYSFGKYSYKTQERSILVKLSEHFNLQDKNVDINEFKKLTECLPRLKQSNIYFIWFKNNNYYFNKISFKNLNDQTFVFKNKSFLRYLKLPFKLQSTKNFIIPRSQDQIKVNCNVVQMFYYTIKNEALIKNKNHKSALMAPDQIYFLQKNNEVFVELFYDQNEQHNIVLKIKNMSINNIDNNFFEPFLRKMQEAYKVFENKLLCTVISLIICQTVCMQPKSCVLFQKHFNNKYQNNKTKRNNEPIFSHLKSCYFQVNSAIRDCSKSPYFFEAISYNNEGQQDFDMKLYDKRRFDQLTQITWISFNQHKTLLTKFQNRMQQFLNKDEIRTYQQMQNCYFSCKKIKINEPVNSKTKYLIEILKNSNYNTSINVQRNKIRKELNEITTVQENLSPTSSTSSMIIEQKNQD